jgi:hypothetical protein
VTVPPNGSATATLTISTTGWTSRKTYGLTVTGSSGSKVRSTSVNVTVN